MYPVLQDLDQLLVESCPPSELIPGDIIVFERREDAGKTAHRLVSIEQDSVRTAGDANLMNDPFPVPFDAILGRVAMIRRGAELMRPANGVRGLRYLRMNRIRNRLGRIPGKVLRAGMVGLLQIIPVHRYLHRLVPWKHLRFPHPESSEEVIQWGRFTVARKSSLNPAWNIRMIFLPFFDPDQVEAKSVSDPDA